MPGLRVALLHHWFVTHGGGERVAECIAALLPTADIFTLIHSPAGLPSSLKNRRLSASFLQKIPRITGMHREWMPLYPEAARSLDLREYDLVVSSDSGPVKGATMRDGTPHLCYCHSPMRYLYDGFESYRSSMSWPKRFLFDLVVPRVRRADKASAQRVTRFVANSHYVQQRILDNYHRESQVIYPPINLGHARVNPPGAAYLAAGRLVDYKKTDIIIRACSELGRPLHIIGTGPQEERLRHLAGPTVSFLGKVPTEQLWDAYSRCRALLFAADEDFGMVPVEAQSCGRPVIAYGVGGSLETIRADNAAADRTGLFFQQQTVESLKEAILRFEAEESSFHPGASQDHAAQFSTLHFLRAMRAAILDMLPAAESCLASVDSAMQVIC